jgi:hypothetical protein
MVGLVVMVHLSKCLKAFLFAHTFDEGRNFSFDAGSNYPEISASCLRAVK